MTHSSSEIGQGTDIDGPGDWLTHETQDDIGVLNSDIGEWLSGLPDVASDSGASTAVTGRSRVQPKITGEKRRAGQNAGPDLR